MSTKVLVVEDEGIIALDLQRRLINLGYDVPRIAANHEQALAAANEIAPDIVLMDINLTGVFDGIQTASKMKSPVIYLTAYSEQKTLDRAKETKPFGYLLKPFAEKELHATLQMALERISYEKRLRENEIQLATVYSKLAVANQELKTRANDLYLDKQRLEITGHCANGGVIATDKLGNVTYLNPVAEQMTGWNLVQAYGKPLSKILIFINEKSQFLELSALDHIIFSKQHADTETNCHLLGDQGQIIPIKHSVTLVHDLENTVAGAIVVFHEFHEQCNHVNNGVVQFT